MQPTGACEQRWLLTERHKADRRAYQTAVTVLRNAINTPEFKEAQVHAAKCQEAFERSRDTLELHILEHGCNDIGFEDSPSPGSMSSSAEA